MEVGKHSRVLPAAQEQSLRRVASRLYSSMLYKYSSRNMDGGRCDRHTIHSKSVNNCAAQSCGRPVAGYYGRQLKTASEGQQA